MNGYRDQNWLSMFPESAVYMIALLYFLECSWTNLTTSSRLSALIFYIQILN